MSRSQRHPRWSLRRQILVRGSAGVLVALTGLAVLLGLGIRMRSQVSAAVDAFVEEQLIADRISQAVMRQLLIVSSVRAGRTHDIQQDFRAAGDLVSEQLRLYLFRDLSPPQRLQLETVKEEHQRLEVAAARAAELFGRGEAAGEESVGLMSTHGFALLGALDAFLRMREADLLSLRRTQRNAFRAIYAVGAVFGAVLLVGSVALVRFLLGKVDAPLSELTAAARRMESGDLDVRIPESREEEFATVAATFNRMAQRVRELNTELEQRVADRTAAFRASEERFRTLATTAHDAIITADAEGAITYFNPAAERTFGCSAEAVLGKPLTVLMPERFREPHRRGLARYLSTGEARVVGRTVELVGLRKDGAEFPLELSLASRQQNGGPIFIGVLRDITERKRTEAALHRYADELEEANMELEAFSYTVSHDLRAPLRAIQGFAQALLEDYAGELDDQGRDYARRLAEAAKRMDALIQDLLAYSRLSRSELKLVPVSVRDAVGEAAEQLRPRIAETRATLHVAADLPTAVGHHRTLVQVFQNLLANAVMFVPDDVTPTVRVRGERLDGGARIWVEDNGIGIAPEHQERIFRVFERLHGLESYPGTGIGLAIVRKGVERMGGRAGVESEPGAGSRFWIELPMPEEAA